jgi:crossover junction endodeoxyribonuclease RuvC
MILGIDPSLTETGVVVLDEAGRIIEALGLKTKKLRGMERIVWVREAIRQRILEHRPQIIVIEGYSFGSRGRAIFNLGELGGVLRVLFYDLQIPYVEVPPTVLKKFLGKGNFSKDEVQAAILEKYNENFNNDNIADAYGLARIVVDIGIEGLREIVVKKEKPQKTKKGRKTSQDE